MGKPCKHSGCLNPIWSTGFCKHHQHERSDEKWIRTLEKKKEGSQGLKNTSIRNSQIANKPRKSINKVSDKMKENLALYRVLRNQYLKDNPICQFPNCTSTELDLHHKKGKIGSLLTDVRYFCGLCRKHHSYCEEQPIIAKELGLSLDRLTV